jgi:uncharacterized membrane protein YhhN
MAAVRTPLLPDAGRPLLATFIAAAVLNVVGQLLAADVLMIISKPLLMPLLFAWVWQVADRPLPRPSRLLLGGLVFAWLGDLFLMGQGDLWFIAGIAGFLVMQVLYILAYRCVPGPGLIRQRPLVLAPFVAFWAGMNLLLDPGVLRIPVLLYSVVLVGMGVLAVDLMARFPRPFGGRVALGAILFVISDAFIALEQFAGLDIGRWQGVIVMGTYTVAQFLIATGFVDGLRARSDGRRSG